MNETVPLTGEELAALEAIDSPDAPNAEPTLETLRLVVLGLIKATPLGFYLSRAGMLRLKAERGRTRDGNRDAAR